MNKFYGVGFVAVLALLVRFFHGLLPNSLNKALGEVVLGVALGLVINQCMQNKDYLEALRDGFKFCLDKLLKFSIILLGLKITLGQIAELGVGTLILIIVLMVTSLLLATFLGKLTNTPRKLAALIGVGTAVCGNTAISAIGPAIKASDEEISFAIATNTLFGTLAVFLYPLVAHWLGLSDEFYGTWTGTAVNDTSQVVATGFSFSAHAGEVATTVKLVRNSLMGVVIIVMTLLYGESGEVKNKTWWQRLKIPPFVLWFLVVATLNSLGLFRWLEAQGSFFSLAPLMWMTKFMILMALISVGLNTKLRSMKEIGMAPLLIGFATASVVSLMSYLVLWVIKA